MLVLRSGLVFMSCVAVFASAGASAQAGEASQEFGDAPTEPNEASGWWLEVGVLAGFGYVHGNLAADTARPSALGGDSPWRDCDTRNERCTVRVEQPGIASQLALRTMGGVAVSPRWSIALGTRVQPAAGEGLLSGWLAELSARVELVRAGRLHAAAQVSVGIGQIQFRPPQDEVDGPWARSGLGWVSASVYGAYEIDPRVELLLELTPRLSFPSPLFVLDLGLGLRVRSG